MKTKIIIMVDDSIIDKDSIVHAIEEVTTTGFDVETEVSIFGEELTNLITFDEINNECKHKYELFDTISKSIDKILNVAIKNTTEEKIPTSLLPMYEVVPEEAFVELYDIGCEDVYDLATKLPKDNITKYLKESGVLEKSEIMEAPIPETKTIPEPSVGTEDEKKKRKVEDELRRIIGGMPHVEEPLYDNKELTDGGISFMIYDSCYDDYVVRTISKHFPDFDNWKGVFMNHYRFDSSVCLEPKLVQAKGDEPYNITVITKGSTFPANTSYMAIHVAQRIVDKIFKIRPSYEDLDKLMPLSSIHTVYSATATLDDMTEVKPYAFVKLNDEDYVVASFFSSVLPKDFDILGKKFSFKRLVCINPMNMIVPASVGYSPIFYIYSRKMKLGKRTLTDSDVSALIGLIAKLDNNVNFLETQRFVREITPESNMVTLCDIPYQGTGTIPPKPSIVNSEIANHNSYKSPADKEDSCMKISLKTVSDSGNHFDEFLISSATAPIYQVPFTRNGVTYTYSYLLKLEGDEIVKAEIGEDTYGLEFVLYSKYDISNCHLYCDDVPKMIDTLRTLDDKSLALTKTIDGVEYSKIKIFGFKPYGEEGVGTDNDITSDRPYYIIVIDANEKYVIASNKTLHPYSRFKIDGTIFESHAAAIKNPEDGNTVYFWLYSPKPIKTEFGTATIFTKKDTIDLVKILKELDEKAMYERNKFLIHPDYKDDHKPTFEATRDVEVDNQPRFSNYNCVYTPNLDSTIPTEPTAFLGTSINYDDLIKDPSKYNVVNICGIVGLLTRYDVTTFIPFHTGPYKYYIERVFNCQKTRLEWTYNKTRSSEWVFITNHAINLPFADMDSPFNEILNSETRMYKYDTRVQNSVYSGVAPGVVPVSQLSHIDTLYQMPKTAEGMEMYDKAATESKCIEELRGEIMAALDNYVKEKKKKGNDENEMSK